MRDIEDEPIRAGVEAECHIGVVARLIKWCSIESERIGGGVVVIAGGIEPLRRTCRRIDYVELPPWGLRQLICNSNDFDLEVLTIPQFRDGCWRC